MRLRSVEFRRRFVEAKVAFMPLLRSLAGRVQRVATINMALLTELGRFPPFKMRVRCRAIDRFGLGAIEAEDGCHGIRTKSGGGLPHSKSFAGKGTNDSRMRPVTQSVGPPLCLLILAVCLLGSSSRDALGQPLGPKSAPRDAPQSTPASGPDASDAWVKELEAKLAEARANIAPPGDSSLTNAPAGVSTQEIWTRHALSYRLVRLYEQQLSMAAELESAKIRKAETIREAQAWTRFAEPVPYSILLADHLREELESERLKLSRSDTGAAMLDQLVEENRNTLNQAEEKIRQLNERLEKMSDAVLAARLSWQRESERLASKVAAATVAMLDAERLIRLEDLAASRARVELLQRQVVIAEAGASFTQADLDQVTTRIETERQQLEGELAEVQTRHAAALEGLKVARADFQSRNERSDATPSDRARAAETVLVRETQLETADVATRVLRLMLEGRNVERTIWEMRFAAYGSHSAGILSDSERRLETLTRRLDLWQEHERQQSELIASQVQLQETRLNNLAPDSELRPLARERLASLRERDELLLRAVRTIERSQHLTLRWAESLRAAEKRLPLTGRLRNLFSDARSFAQRLWSFEIFTAEDTITVDGQKITGKRGITVGKIAMALIILVVGYWSTGLVSAYVEPVFVKRLKIDPNQANLIRRWLRTLLLICLVMFSLVSVKIPLTIFAFAGGALAIGLGFGMQTLLKNFVSGLIILFERPFRVGDVLDVGGQRGTMTSVGLRASVLQLWDGTETLIPNSTLLENNLTNWTYSNSKVRFSVLVGVAYGSDPRRVIQVLNEIAERHGLVEKEPKPQVFFTDFGDSALSFELRFWVNVTQANAAQVSSDLRLMIAGTFAEQAITVAFPQRDVHLHAGGPIQVEVVSQTSLRAPIAQNPNGVTLQ
jgi:small-conductance mechanosensitive channel